MNRRTYLAAAGVLSAVSAGCLTGDPGSGETPHESPDNKDPATQATPTSGNNSRPTTGHNTAEQHEGETTPVHHEYETTEIRIVSPAGVQLGEVTAEIADTRELRYLGLSDTESLPNDRGMLFVHESVQDLTYVMREMNFPIDIVFADAEGVITRISHARAPEEDEDGTNLRYPGRGKYVLEVNHHWTTDRGIGDGDILEFALP